MASGDIHVTVVPAVSTVEAYTYTNDYGNTVTSTEKMIAGDPVVLSKYINEQQAATPAKTLLQVLDQAGPRIVLVFKES